MNLTDLPGIGAKTAEALESAGITDTRELLETYPRTYREYRATNTRQGGVGEYVVLKGTLTKPISKHTNRLTTQLSTFQDEFGTLTLRWFNQPFLVRSIRTQATYLVKGKIEEFRGVKQIVSPQLSVVEDDELLTDQLVPIYSQMGNLKPWIFRTKISGVLDSLKALPDPLPSTIIDKYSLLPYREALTIIHQPLNKNVLESAIYRLSFQELYELQINALRSHKSVKKLAQALSPDSQLLAKFIKSLPFQLTQSQQNAIKQINTSLSSTAPMHRLLAGEVGSGKTVVAASAAMATYTAGYRTLVMAPTLILAEQLYESLSGSLSPLGLSVSLVHSGKEGTLTADVIVGTQALLRHTPEKVGLVVIDEQHRFGVKQRDKLTALSVHTLLMTATPIPRSLAQTIFGYLDVTLLTDLPPGRVPVKTYVVPDHKRADSYVWLSQLIKQGNQVFIVTPLIECSEEKDESPLKSLQELELSLKHTFPNLRIDIMHGQMKSEDKSAHMLAFRDGITDILIATSMIEVGVDIPKANIIVIEDAERFGLATLHQLRGRVGRGGDQGYCLLFSNSQTLKSKERLKYFIRTLDGAKLALYDLQDRGPGELFGDTQHGFFNLKLASIYDRELIQATHSAAKLTLAKKG